LIIASAAPPFAASNSVYVETRATLSQTGDTGPLPIPGLSIVLPIATAAYNTAIVTLNMPNLYLTHVSSQFPMSAEVQVMSIFSPVGFLFAEGQIGCDTKGINISSKKPLTIVLEIPLSSGGTQNVETEWFSTSGDTVSTDTFASLSAVLVRK
jgi:hypothetical protein